MTFFFFFSISGYLVVPFTLKKPPILPSVIFLVLLMFWLQRGKEFSSSTSFLTDPWKWCLIRSIKKKSVRYPCLWKLVSLFLQLTFWLQIHDLLWVFILKIELPSLIPLQFPKPGVGPPSTEVGPWPKISEIMGTMNSVFMCTQAHIDEGMVTYSRGLGQGRKQRVLEKGVYKGLGVKSLWK